MLYNKRVKGSCWATPLAVGDRLYYFGKDGTTTVLSAGATYEVHAENQLWEAETAPAGEKSAETPAPKTDPAAAMFGGPVLYGGAAVNGNLIIRTGNKLYCIQK